MSLKPQAGYEATLRQAADWLVAGGEFPIDVLRVCAKLGVAVGRSATVPERKAKIVSSDSGARILLGPGRLADTLELTGWDRFLIAHELGHLILYKEHNAKPLGESEYWKHERLCDSFAHWLLIPACKAHEAAAVREPTASARLAASCGLERSGRVPWPVAASAISEVDENVVFFKVADLDKPHLRVRFSTLSNKKGIHTKVDRASPAGKALLAIPLRNPIQEVNCSFIRDLLWSKAQSCAAVRFGDPEIRVAVTCLSTPQ
jgi:uncharacterized protein DUF955